MSLELYNKVRSVPDDAKKTINGGRLNGKTDINPMWRIKTLTEQFGPCGIGWKYVITDKRLEKGFGDEVAAFVDIELFIAKTPEQMITPDGMEIPRWSDAIPGTGGSMFVAKESKGPYTSDECFKMALTDALSVACKALGIGADVYWSADASKYPTAQQTVTGAPGKSVSQTPEKTSANPTTAARVTTKDLDPIYKITTNPDGTYNLPEAMRFKEIYERFGFKTAKEITVDVYDKIKAEFLDYALPDVLK